MINRQKKFIKLAAGFLLLLAIVLISSTFIEIPLKIRTYAEVFPKEKWIITRGNGGQIISSFIDYVQGHAANYDIAQFERGEFVSVNFMKYLKNKKELSKGDTIISMRSSDIRDRIVAAEGKLEIAFANLKSQSSAEKGALIKEAESQLKYNQAKISEQKVLFNRAKQLYEKELCSQQDYESQKWALELLEIEGDIYRAQIENLKTGVKPEEIKHLEAEIKSAKEYLTFLKEKEAQLTLLSPLNGKIISSFSPDTLLNATNTGEIVIHAPIKAAELAELKTGQTVQTSFSNMDNTKAGLISSIDQEIRIINGQQFVFVSMVFENKDNFLLPGMIVETSFTLRKVRLFDSIIKLFTN